MHGQACFRNCRLRSVPVELAESFLFEQDWAQMQQLSNMEKHVETLERKPGSELSCAPWTPGNLKSLYSLSERLCKSL